MSSSKNFLISIFLLTFNIALAQAARFDIINYCPYTLWAAAIPGGGKQLASGQTWSLNVKAGTTRGRIWARTKCQFGTVRAAAVADDGRQLASGQSWPSDVNVGITRGQVWASTSCHLDGPRRGICETGDCGGFLECTAYGSPPNTLAEYALNQFQNKDFIDMSIVDGFNVPMEFSSTSGSCNRVIRCTANIIGECPDELRVPGGCNGPCNVSKTGQYCCNSGKCGPTDYSPFFKERCPDVYSYPTDDATSAFTCPGGTNYKVVFCP